MVLVVSAPLTCHVRVLRVPSHHEITKSCGALVSRFENQCSHRSPQYRDPVSTSLFFELTIDLCSRDDHFRNNRCYPIGSLATMLEQIGTMGFPNVHYAKTTIRSTVDTYPQINLPAWQAEFWHIGDRAKDITTEALFHHGLPRSPNPVLNIQPRVSLETWAFRRNRTAVVQVVERCRDG